MVRRDYPGFRPSEHRIRTFRLPRADGSETLSVNMRPGHTPDELVAEIFSAREEGREHELVIAHLCEEFGLSIEDAELAIDRVCGGVVRAMTGSTANCPNQTKDPIAWMGFQRAIARR